MRKKILFFIILSFCFISNINALTYGGCDYSVISRLKSLVTNINLSYDYHISNNEVTFDVTINNVTSDMYFYDTTTNKTYYYSDTNNGELTIYGYNTSGGSYKFYSAKGECYGISLGSKYYNFPTYNYYYNDPLCSDIPNYSLCQRWAQVNYSYSEFEDKILEYKESLNKVEDNQELVEYQPTIIDTLVDLYVNYYYIFLIAIILICSIIIFVKSRNNKFNL